LRWEAGPILPESIAATKLSENEKSYFRYYSDILADEQGVIELEEMKVDNRKLFF
jgi:hypothetical protein